MAYLAEHGAASKALAIATTSTRFARGPDVAARLAQRVFELARHEATSQWQPETQSAYAQWDMFGGVIRPWCDRVGDACDPPKWGTTPGSR